MLKPIEGSDKWQLTMPKKAMLMTGKEVRDLVIDALRSIIEGDDRFLVDASMPGVVMFVDTRVARSVKK